MKPASSLEYNEQDREMIKLLEELGSFESSYPSELLTARRAAFLAQVEQLAPVAADEGLAAGDEKIVQLLGTLKLVQEEYPVDMLAARRAALLRELHSARPVSVLDRARLSLQRLFSSEQEASTMPPGNVRRLSLVLASLVAVVVLGSLFLFRPDEPSFQPSPLGVAGEPTRPLPSVTREAELTICGPGGQTTACPPGEMDPDRDLAYAGNGAALPAVSKDARADPGGTYTAAYVNDGREGASWVSNSADSWIKIDLGKVTTINTVSLQKGSPGSAEDHDPGQFVIAVALSDVYADGDSSHDYAEYAQVFHSKETGFSGRVSPAETIQTRFSPVRARYVKITFEKAGAAIEEIGVFMVEPPEVASQPTRTPEEEIATLALTAVHTNTASSLSTATSAPTGTRLPTNTPVPALTNTLTVLDTPVPLPTQTFAPAYTATPLPPVPTQIVPSNTPLPSPTAVPPTLVPPTDPPVSTDPIIVTSSDQTLTFTCNGNAVEIRGHNNTVTLLGSCSSITVRGNGNLVYWQFGSPVITITGQDNIVSQL